MLSVSLHARLFTFKFSVDSHTYTHIHSNARILVTNCHCSIRKQLTCKSQVWSMGRDMYGCEQLKRERERGRGSMGWDRIVHRGLRNKWSDSPAAILFRLYDKAFK